MLPRHVHARRVPGSARARGIHIEILVSGGTSRVKQVRIEEVP
jgi:hypothetical protein